MVAKFWLKAVSVGNDTLEYVGELSEQSLVPEGRMLVSSFVSEHLSGTLILVILFLDIIIITCMQP